MADISRDTMKAPYKMDKMSHSQQKEPFRFEYTKPSLDWYDIVKVEINPGDYTWFKLELRYGNTWWLVGMNPPKSDFKASYMWDETEIGRVSTGDIIRFIKWAECGFHGNRITEIKAISNSLNIVNEVAKLINEMEKKDAKK